MAGAREMRQPLGDATHLVFGDAQHFRHLGKGAARLKGRETADYRGVLGAVFLEDQINDVVFGVVGEIHVNVGQLIERHAVLIEEPSEVEVEADGADVADFEAIAGERIGGAAARDPFDATPATFLEEVPDDEEIFFVTNFGDNGQLLFDLGFEMVQFGFAGRIWTVPRIARSVWSARHPRAFGPANRPIARGCRAFQTLRAVRNPSTGPTRPAITALEALHDEPAQKGGGRRAVRRRKTGELRLAE